MDEKSDVIEAATADRRPRLHQNAPVCTTSHENAEGKAKPAPPAELTPQKMKALALLVSGKTFSQAAAQIGVDRSTVFRWRREAVFTDELNRQLGETLDVVAMRTRSALLASTALIAQELLSHDEKHRTHVAFKVINSKRVWEIGSELRPLPEEA